MVFAGDDVVLVSGATVTISSGAAAVTDRRGGAFLSPPPGRYTLRIEIPGAQLPAPSEQDAPGVAFEIANVVVVAGEMTRVLLTLSDEGKLLDADVRVPAALLPQRQATAEDGATQAAPSGPAGTITGRVVSTDGNTPIAGAKLYVLGRPAEAQTGADGRFTITVAEGSHTLTVVHIDYTGQTLEGVTVSAGVESQLDIQLVPAPVEMADYLVKGRRVRGSIATVMDERREATSVTDAIGAEDIRKSPDGTASAATRRVVGATVVGGQFLFVRGLGGRYSNVRLNSVPLPSTDPDLPGFQLDLFPATLLSSLTIAKTFTPDIPGDFAGGSMNIATRDFPDHLEVTASVSLTSDTQTLGRDMASYDGGDLDFLGFDDGTRALPDAVPENEQVVRQRRQAGESVGLSDERRAEIGAAFPNHWEIESRGALPVLGLGFSIGNTTELAGNRFGYLFTLGYRYASNRYVEQVINATLAPEGAERPVMPRETLRREVGKESAQIGLLGTLSYELGKGQDLTAVSVLTQTGDDEASRLTGRGESEGAALRQTELTFIERRLLFNQLLGAHDLDAFRLDWQVNAATVQREQPDTRGLIYVDSPVGFVYSQTSGSGERFYTDLAQQDFGGGANATVPIADAELESGYLGRVSDREFAGRRFEAVDVPRTSPDLSLGPEQLFAEDNWGSLWLPDELTEVSDGYGAEQELHAGYGLADVPITGWLRLTGGARIESFRQTVAVEPPISSLDADDLEAADRTDTDGLPAGAVILGLSDAMSLRLAYGGTVARPLVRELAPFRVQDFVRRRNVQGNPDLRRTYIHNLDARWELFPSPTEVLAASVFYKIFLDPIEAIVLDTRGNLTYENTESARNYGVELEARTDLGRFGDALEDFVLAINFAWIHSSIALSDEQLMTATSQERPLQGQSPYVANLSLGYSPSGTGLSLNLFYNVFGRRISEVGRNRIPDSYEEPFHSLDFTASYQLAEHWTLGVSATNLLLQQAVVEQGGLEISRIDRGTSFGVRLGFAN
jgi:TonB dependent receptor/Carboxypeptidase regulatory-like domain/TonB-dependent Receptor Plug Domain